MLSIKIESIAHALRHRLRGDGQVRMPKKEAQGFIANLESCAEQAKALERATLFTPNARREADRPRGDGRWLQASGVYMSADEIKRHQEARP